MKRCVMWLLPRLFIYKANRYMDRQLLRDVRFGPSQLDTQLTEVASKLW